MFHHSFHLSVRWLILPALLVWFPLIFVAGALPEQQDDRADPVDQEQRSFERRVAELDQALTDLRRQTDVRRRSPEVVANQARPLLDEALELAEPEPTMCLRTRSVWNHVCQHAIGLMRHDDPQPPQHWRQLHERLVDLTPEVDQEKADQPGQAMDRERARLMHEDLCRKTLIMLLHRLPPGYALDELERVRAEMRKVEEGRVLTSWLHDLQTHVPPVAKGDALGLPIDPQLGEAVARLMLELVQDKRIDYRRRRSVVMDMAAARHSSGHSREAGRMIDAWRKRHPAEVADDIEMTWLRFNVALFGDGDRESAGRWFSEMNRIIENLPADHQGESLGEYAARHYFRLLPLGAGEYDMEIIDFERKYLTRRQRELHDYIARNPHLIQHQ